uniref:G domain-containing protein n=1 Tax=Sparus aurata TaxID=8175 RepID=A0A671WY21_SPAAU
IPWGCKERDLQVVRDYKPHNEELEQLRIMLHGPTGSGKSSFINSVDTVLQGRMTSQALEDAVSQDTFTKEVRITGPGTLYPFVFTDIMGLEKETNQGVSVEDLKLAMSGHIKDGYNFNPFSAISVDNSCYNKAPTLKDRVHLLVCVIPAASVNLQSAESVAKMRAVRLAARNIGIPQLAILTKIDEACPQVKADIKNVYMSMYLKKQMEVFSDSLGIPVKCIFPVKNYHSEIDPDDDTDTLILSALKHMINLGEDFVNQQ